MTGTVLPLAGVTTPSARTNYTMPVLLALALLSLAVLPWYGERVEGSALVLAFGSGRWWLAPPLAGWLVVLAGWRLGQRAWELPSHSWDFIVRLN